MKQDAQKTNNILAAAEAILFAYGEPLTVKKISKILNLEEEKVKAVLGDLDEELKEELTPAGLETLSIIAYFGPVSKIKIDYFRGVNSAFILRNLLMRGLIDRSDKSKEEGYAYSLNFDALKHLGISKIEELPEYEKYKNN